jgi:L-threonylcarbamoyladenylate synthase
VELITLAPDATTEQRRSALARPALGLRAGHLVVFPTETVYGLGAHAFDANAVARVFAVKGRPANDPLIVHVLAHWPLDAVFEAPTPLMRRLVAHFWPGPLTLVAARAAGVPNAVTSGSASVAVRAPAHPVAQCLLDLAGVAVAAPSANRFGFVSPSTAAHVLADIGPQCDWVIDGGPTFHGIESTVVAVDGDSLRILRHGSVTAEQLAAHGELREPDPRVSMADKHGAAEALASPGMLTRHYAPETRTIAVIPGARLDHLAGADSRLAVYLGYDDRPRPPHWAGAWRSLGNIADLAGVARNLYAALHEADDAGHALIVVELTERPELGRAIDDRVRRSASGVVWT